MTPAAPSSPPTDVSILARLIRPDDTTMEPGAAEALLAIQFEPDDLDRIHELTVKNQSDLLSDRERLELDHYRRVGSLLDLLHAKARLALKRSRSTG